MGLEMASTSRNSHMVRRKLGLLVMALAITSVTAGCTSNQERGRAESAGATAGRVIDDSVITGKVKSGLVADSTTKAYQIEVETYQGTVQLSGFVDNAEQRRRAAEVARNVEGVKNVKNSLELRSKQ
jgi:hyperosmotically inducible periplasmic protein